MNKQKILELTGLSEDQFYDQYPDQETFCSDYPDACNQLEEAQVGMQVGKVYDKYGNETFTPAPDPIHSDWQINEEGMNVRPRTVDRFGNPIGPTTQVLRIPVDRVPFNREPTMQRLNPAMQSLQNASPNNVPVSSPIDILTPLIARYSLPKGMVQNSIPIEKLSAKQTMQQVGSTGAPYSAPVNKYESIVDLLNSKKMDSSMSSRKKLAEEYDISNYTGTSTQNKLLLDKINNLNEVNKVNNTPSINQINNEDYNYLAPSEEKQILNKFIPTKYPNINDVSTRYNSALNNMSLQNLLKSNPTIENPNLIHPGDRINISNKTIQTKAPVRQVLNSINYPITATDGYGRSDAYNNIYGNVNIPVKKNITKNKIINTPKALPNKKEQQPFIPDTPNIPTIPINNENRHLESGMIEDKNKNLMYVIKDNQVVKTFPIMTGLSRNENVNNRGLAWLEAHPKEAKKYRATPTGTYLSNPNSNIYGHAGFNMQPIAAFGEPAPLARGLAQHVVYGMGPKGSSGYDPAEGRRRMKIMAGPDEQRIGSYGCTNMHGQDIDCLTGQLFPQGDTTIVVDTRLAKDKQFIQNFQHEQGGTAIFPSMRNFKQGGYYGMDQKFHPNSDSGTYVNGAGYYFQPGGTTAAPAAPTAGADGIRADGSFAVNDSEMPDGGYDGSGMMMDDSASEQSSPFDYNTSQFSEQSANKQQPYDQQQTPVYDPSQYTSEIDPSTGFTKYKKNGLAIRNIKREDPTLWNNLTEQGHGARWATGQTDIQRVGRTAGAIGQGLEAGINVAGVIGGYLNNRNKQRNMDKSAMNMGSTASMFTNPQGSGKGDYGVTGSTYGQFKPNQGGNMSFKGMYAKYGMQVPSYQSGGGFNNLFASAQSTMPVINPLEYTNNISTTRNYPVTNNIPVNDNTRVSVPRVVENIKDLIATQESGGNYKALPWKDKAHTKLASSAAGKYQFLWGDHKDDIQKVTGVKTKQDFLNNPDAQEEFFDYWDQNTLTPWANKIKSQLNIQLPINKIKAAIHFSGPKGAWNYFSKGIASKDKFGMDTGSYMNNFKYGGQQHGGQVVDMDENQIQQFLAAGGQLEFLD